MSADAWNGSWGASWGQAWGSLFQPARLGPGPMGGIVVHEFTHSAKAATQQNRAGAKLRADIGAAMYRVQDDEDAAILMLLDSPMLSPGYEAAAEAMFQRIEAALEAEDEALKN